MGIVDEAARLERAGYPMIHLEKGELGLDTPAPVKQAAIEALLANKTRYSHSSGLPELRQAVADYYTRQYGLRIDPQRVIVNSGSSASLIEIFLALLSPGDEVVLPDPGYPAYPRFITAARGVPVQACSATTGYQHTAELVREHLTPRTKAVLVNFPSNPTGAVADATELAAFSELGPLVVADEVYHGLEADGRHSQSILEFTNNAVVVGSLSKAYAMTGWRLGYLIVPQQMVTMVTRMHEDLFVGTNTFVQWAAITALGNATEIQRQIREELNIRRNCLLAELSRLGLQLAHQPHGAFYVFVRQWADTGTSAQLAADLLQHAYVAITPGSVFGPSGEGNIRFSLSASARQIAVAMRRVETFLVERECWRPDEKGII
jgi:aspartate/methionine/tyrosine aminotransferase